MRATNRDFLVDLPPNSQFPSVLRSSTWLVLLLLVAGTAGAANPKTAIGTGTVYRLNKDSSFEQGCFPPCLCPVLIGATPRGTFLLAPTGFDGLFNTYAVSDVNWLVSIGGSDTIVTGSGTYKVGGEVALQQELSLDLQVGGGKVEHFDSGLVGGAAFPDINATVSVNGQVCFDTVFGVRASPVPLDQIRPYRLLSGSTFQRGCFEACDCAIGPIESITGTFDLVPLETTSLSREFALIDVRWQVMESSKRIPVRGFGTYKLGGEFAIEHELSLLLAIGGEDSAHFDSGLVPGGGNFPRIDSRISVVGAICFDTVIDIHAAPSRTH